MNRIHLRTDISPAAARKLARSAGDSSERRAWRAIADALQQRGTATEIARRQGRSRPWFSVVRRKFQKHGLQARYSPNSSGRPSRLTEEQREYLKQGFLSRTPIPQLQGWLKKRGVDVTCSYLYSLRKKWGCVPVCPTRADHPAKGRRRSDRLEAHVPRRIIALIRALLCAGGKIPKGPTHKKLGIIFYLALRDQVLREQKRGRITASQAKLLAPPPHRVMAVFGSSRRFIYEVHDTWIAVGGDWQQFIQRQLTSVAARDVLGLSGALRLDMSEADTTEPIEVYLDDHLRAVLGRGQLRREKLNTNDKWVETPI